MSVTRRKLLGYLVVDKEKRSRQSFEVRFNRRIEIIVYTLSKISDRPTPLRVEVEMTHNS